MGFIASEINKWHDKYVSMEDILLAVQKMDSDEPSLQDTAKFLLRKYEETQINDIPFGGVDEVCFTQTLSGGYVRARCHKPLFNFLTYVAYHGYLNSDYIDLFDIDENHYAQYFLEKETVTAFLQYECGLKDFHGWQEFEQESQAKGEQPANDEDTEEDAEQADQPYANTPQQKRAENMQASIIVALACMYTKTDCSKPYEAAETIRQEWQRQSDKLGNPPSKDTIGKYILQGIERLSN